MKELVKNDDRYDSVRKNVQECDVVLIDEVSMLSRKDFEQLEMVCRIGRDNNWFFGGLQVVASGDFYQLPPVPNALYNDSGAFCFQSDIWDNVFDHRINLDTVVRQSEPKLINAVRETARGKISLESEMF